MTPEQLKDIKKYVTSDKTWVNDAYYRLREVTTGYEFAKLEMDACGASVVCPQILLEYHDGELIPVQLIDLSKSPTLFIEYTEETKEELEKELILLIEECEKSYHNV